MKRIMILILTAFLILPAAAHAGAVFALIEAENEWTDPITIVGIGSFFIEDTGSFTGTVTLQCKPYGGSNWVDVNTQTVEGMYVITNGGTYSYRVGVATGNFAGTSVTVYLQGN